VSTTAKAEVKRLMAEVSQLQAKNKSANASVKMKAQQLVKEINQLQLLVIKNKDQEKFQQVKEKTRELFESQIEYNLQRQQNIREQMNRLLQAQKKYENIAQDELNNTDQRLLQQLKQLTKTKKNEFIQISKEIEEIRQRANNKNISLSPHLSKTTAHNKPLNRDKKAIANGAKKADKTEQENLADRAKTEAEKLIVAVSQGQSLNNNNTGNTTSHKTQEIGKMIDEISRLQMSADKGNLSDDEIEILEERVRSIEEKQRNTRDQINQLTQAKIKYELAVNRSSEIRDQAQQRREQDEQLQKELNHLISQKENEQQLLLDELKQIRERSEQESALLKAQRDAARALAEEKQDNTTLANDTLDKKHSLISVLLVSLAILLLVTAGGAYYFLFYKADNSISIEANNKSIKKAAEKLLADKAKEQVKAKEKEKEARKQALKSIKIAPVRIFRDKLKSGGYAPMMVQLPDGSFTMGSKPQLPYMDEHPAIKIQLGGFAIGKYEVTLKEYRRFSSRTGRNMPDTEGWDADKQPVVNVTFDDAEAYCKWLTEETGHRYRLPSEREWEYAAKAGSEQKLYWWGNRFKKKQANCGDCGNKWDNQKPAPVGEFEANAFGLYDVLGNVLEWTRSCYHANYTNAPTVGQIWETNADCHYRMVRSSTYSSYKKDVRTTKRTKLRPNARTDNLGFRIMRIN